MSYPTYAAGPQMTAEYSEFLAWKATRRINVSSSWRCAMLLPPPVNISTNAPAWLSIQELYGEFPERFTVIGDIHSDRVVGGQTYFSMRYNRPRGGSWTFHAYGYVDGTRFYVTAVTQAYGGTVMEIFHIKPLPPIEGV
jgi:hypothetical protein